MKRPKLLHINSYSGSGSIGRIIDQISSKATLNGWDCYVVSGSRYSKCTQTTRINFSSKFSEVIHYFVSFLFDRHGFGSYFETWCLIRRIKRLQPDLIHLHNLHGYYLNVPLLIRFLRKSDIPVVWTFHDCWNFTGHCVHFDYVGCDKWKKGGCNHCSQRKTYPASFRFDASASNFQIKKNLFTSLTKLHIVTVSHWLHQVVSESFFHSYPILTIYNGLDLDIFKFHADTSLHLHRDAEYVLLGVAAAWTSRKGFYDYMALRKLLPKQYKILLIGLTEKQIQSLPPGIVGIARTTDVQELVDYYSESDIVLNLSYEETLGMTTLEGLACGKPSIVYNRTASPELISPETGRIVEAGDIEQLAVTIQSMCACLSSFDPVKCRQRVCDHFNKEKCFVQYVDLYNQLLKRK